MAREKRLNQGKIDEAERDFGRNIRVGEGAVKILPEYSLADAYVDAGIPKIEARERVLKKLKNYKERLEDPELPSSKRKPGIWGIHDRRISEFEKYVQEAKNEEEIRKYEKDLSSGEHPRYLGRNIEKQLVVIASVASLGAGFVFTSPTITGNTIGRANIIDSSIIGIAFFILGLVGLFLCLRKK